MHLLRYRSVSFFGNRYLGGYVAAAFFAVGAPAALLIGYLCDKYNRRNLLFIVVILGACFLVTALWPAKHAWFVGPFLA